MSRDIKRRLARLEHLRREAAQRDPKEVCRLVLEWYNDPDNVKLPVFTGREKVIADAMANMLYVSDPENWWDYEKTLPLTVEDIGERK